MSHIPRSFIAYRKLALKVLGRYALFSRTDQVDRQKPLGQGQMRVMKDGPDSYRKVIFAIHALIKVAHFAGFTSSFVSENARLSTPNTDKTLGPAYALKMFDALFFSIEFLEDFNERRWLVHG